MADTGKSGAPSEDIFSVERIRKLIELMKEHELTEIDLQQDEQRIRLARGSQAPVMVAASAPAAQSVMQSPVSSSAPSAPAPAAAAASDGAHIVTVTSPMVGTFYSRPNPNAKNFVEVGGTVQGDSTICIIEAMKVFNEIPAEVSGKVVEVLVKNEEAVDFGKPLFKVDTRG